MKATALKPVFVEFIPERLDDGFIYVSEKYAIALHRCCCGCGEEVVTPLTPAEWSLRIEKAGVTLYPSIGNWGLACQSHYWIRGGQVVWDHPMSATQIAQVRARDRRDKQRQLNERNAAKAASPPATVPRHQITQEGQGITACLLAKIAGWLRRKSAN